jgi:deoxyhypusine monooxygenase
MSSNVTHEKITSISDILADTSRPMAERFRALFTLRNIGGHKCVDAIGNVLVKDESALLKHECGYCLGQMQDNHANQVLIDVLSNINEHPMVRHECGEALGAIGDERVLDVLKVRQVVSHSV